MDTTRPLPGTERIATRLAHPQLDAALELLVVVLADPEHSTVDLELAAEVADVVSGLTNTRPLMPPLVYPDRGAADDAHALGLLGHAASQLGAAALASPDPAERLRAGIAARRIHHLVERWQP